MEKETIETRLNKHAGRQAYYAGIVLFPVAAVFLIVCDITIFTIPQDIVGEALYAHPMFRGAMIYNLIGLLVFMIALPLFLKGRRKIRSKEE